MVEVVELMVCYMVDEEDKGSKKGGGIGPLRRRGEKERRRGEKERRRNKRG